MVVAGATWASQPRYQDAVVKEEEIDVGGVDVESDEVG